MQDIKQQTKPVELSPDDWVEIWSALGTKAHDVENGDLGGETHDSTPNGCRSD